uniref:Uncharacterized protein n=1 Tax=Rhizophora mucronata TaxID=61149 RepID=A0A2P2K6U0_RHIMU
MEGPCNVIYLSDCGSITKFTSVIILSLFADYGMSYICSWSEHRVRLVWALWR